MFSVAKEIEFDAGHRVPNHKSKCRNPHGHRYKVRAAILGELITEEGASDEGMLADFGDLKKVMMELIHDVLDHGFIVYVEDHALLDVFGMRDTPLHEPPFGWKVIEFPYIPTAENLALWSFEQLKLPMERMGFQIDYVTVWETPTSTATYMEPIDAAR